MYIKNPKIIIKELKLIKRFSSYHDISFKTSLLFLRKYFKAILGLDYNKFVYKDAIDRIMEILQRSKG